jgi:hypothetical protein
MQKCWTLTPLGPSNRATASKQVQPQQQWQQHRQGGSSSSKPWIMQQRGQGMLL